MFQTDLKLPVVVKVIFVKKAFLYSKFEITQIYFLWISAEVDAANMFNSEMLTVNGELMKVFVIPAHNNLKDMMKISDGTIAADKKAPPDSRADSE